MHCITYVRRALAAISNHLFFQYCGSKREGMINESNVMTVQRSKYTGCSFTVIVVGRVPRSQLSAPVVESQKLGND
jgi:hypothetical protein